AEHQRFGMQHVVREPGLVIAVGGHGRSPCAAEAQDVTESAMTAPLPTPYEVRAFNQAAASENKIHDDAVAQRFGFRGALVPGVTVFAYMAHQPVARWGRAWIERGAAECRFRKPVYDGDIVRVSAQAEGDGLTLEVESGGEHCAEGLAFMPAARP